MKELVVRQYQYHTALEFWMVIDPDTNRELGSYVPATRSARVGPTLHSNIASSTEAMRLFAEYAESLPDLARAGDGFMCQIG